MTSLKCVLPYTSLKLYKGHHYFKTFCIENCLSSPGTQWYLHDNFINDIREYEFTLPDDNFPQFSTSLAQRFLRLFKTFKQLFNNFELSPLVKIVSLHFKKLDSLYSRKICGKSGWNWPSGFWEKVENVKIYRQTKDRHKKSRWYMFLDLIFMKKRLDRLKKVDNLRIT